MVEIFDEAKYWQNQFFAISQIFPINSYSYVAMAPWQSMHPGQLKGSIRGIFGLGKFVPGRKIFTKNNILVLPKTNLLKICSSLEQN